MTRSGVHGYGGGHAADLVAPGDQHVFAKEGKGERSMHSIGGRVESGC